MARLGSFAAPVDLPDHLRPWQAAGLDALFLPGGLPAEWNLATSDSSGFSSMNIAPSCAHALTPAADGVVSAAPEPEAGRSPDLDWPEPWRSIASRVRATPRIIITYASLTADVTGKADPARRKLFQSILAYMGWPQGTSLFWPCVDVPGAPAVARNVFLNGALSFGVRQVACFGHDAAHIATSLFAPGADDPEVRVVVLPGPEELIGLLPHELHRAVAALKALSLT